MKMNKITLSAKILNDSSGNIKIYDRQRLEDFKRGNYNKEIEVTLEVMDKPEYYQHKYYRGGLLPAIAEAMGEKNVDAVHIYTKMDFLYKEIDCIENIPKKYLFKGIYEIRISDIVMIESLNDFPCSLIKGCILVVSKAEGLLGYIPSTSDLTYDEMQKYIERCENRLFVDLNGRLSEYWGKYRGNL